MPDQHVCRIAIVDDYAAVAETIATYIRRMGCKAEVFTNPLTFLETLATTSYDIVITDIRMPQMDGISLLKKVKRQVMETEIILVSAHADKQDAIKALKFGAYDFFEKPVSETELAATIRRTLAYQEVVRQRDSLAQRMSLITERESKEWGINAFVGNGRAMQEMVGKVRRLQRSAKTNVLILGESGTGKELTARAIHYGSPRADGPFVTVNCSAIPADLAESILFGHAKGAFTGAIDDRKGQFAAADGGTLFLDEIGDMPAMVQTKLLRVLEDGVVTPVGRSNGTRVNVRVLSATNTNLDRRIQDGRFRSDLYHRLAGYVIELPPLRQRPEDIPLLIRHFVGQLSTEMAVGSPGIEDAFVAALVAYPFPGNVRELKNILERSLIDAHGRDLGVEVLPPLTARIESSDKQVPESPGIADGKSEAVTLEAVEKAHARRMVDRVQGNIAEAARLMGISRSKLYRLLKTPTG